MDLNLYRYIQSIQVGCISPLTHDRIGLFNLADFFDGKHNIVLGGSWATHPRIAGRKTL